MYRLISLGTFTFIISLVLQNGDLSRTLSDPPTSKVDLQRATSVLAILSAFIHTVCKRIC